MIELPFKMSLGVMLLIKNKTCTSILRRREQPQGEGSWFPKGNSNPANSTLRSRDSPVCLHPLKCPQTVSGGVCPHESDPPLRERKRSGRPLLTQAPNRVRSGMRAEQAALVLGGHYSQLSGQLYMGKQRCREDVWLCLARGSCWLERRTPPLWVSTELCPGPQVTLVTCWSHTPIFQLRKQRSGRQKEHWGWGELRRPEKIFKRGLYPFGSCGIYLSRTFSFFCLPFLPCQSNLSIEFVSSLRKWPCELEKQMPKSTEPH